MKNLPASVNRTLAHGAQQQDNMAIFSAFTGVLTLDWLTPSALGASRKFRCSATAMN